MFLAMSIRRENYILATDYVDPTKATMMFAQREAAFRNCHVRWLSLIKIAFSDLRSLARPNRPNSLPFRAISRIRKSEATLISDKGVPNLRLLVKTRWTVKRSRDNLRKKILITQTIVYSNVNNVIKKLQVVRRCL